MTRTPSPSSGSLGFDQVDILAFSLGSFIAQEIAQAEPQPVRKPILADTGPAGGRGIDRVPATWGGSGEGPDLSKATTLTAPQLWSAKARSAEARLPADSQDRTASRAAMPIPGDRGRP